MAYTMQQLLALAAVKFLPTTKCRECGENDRGALYSKPCKETNWLCEECYFKALSEVIEKNW